jgi:anti-sigma factor RsiW
MQDLITAYCDGELPGQERKLLEAHLRQCASCSATLKNVTALKSALNDQTLVYAAPLALRSGIESLLDKAATPAPPHPRPHTPPPPRQPIAIKLIAYSLSAVLAVAAGILGYRLVWPDEDRRLAREAVEDHQRALATGHITDISSADPPTVLRWLGQRLNFTPMAPNRPPAGSVLVGGRLELFDSRHVSVLVYRSGSRQVEIFQWPASTPQTPPSSGTSSGAGTASWKAAGMSFIAVSDGGADLATQFANAYLTTGCTTH